MASQSKICWSIMHLFRVSYSFHFAFAQMEHTFIHKRIFSLQQLALDGTPCAMKVACRVWTGGKQVI